MADPHDGGRQVSGPSRALLIMLLKVVEGVRISSCNLMHSLSFVPSPNLLERHKIAYE